MKTAREHGCHFGHPWRRAVLVARAITQVLQVENNYDVINNRLPISMARVGRVHGCPKMIPVFTGSQHGCHFGQP